MLTVEMFEQSHLGRLFPGAAKPSLLVPELGRPGGDRSGVWLRRRLGFSRVWGASLLGVRSGISVQGTLDLR